jgi:hypothetical protein
MRNAKRVGQCFVGLVVVGALLVKAGCGGAGFLGLEDYQRDLLLGGLAAALLAQQANAAAADDGAGAPVDGRDGEDGLNCWDLNGNGTGDPAEDINSDGTFDALDCQGVSAADDEPAEPGQDGAPGLSCWDLDGNGLGDATEDVNGDGVFDALDCQGPAGEPGPAGEDGEDGRRGPSGADGPEYFDTFVDDFFTAEEAPLGNLPVVLVSIQEPVLGLAYQRDVPADAVAYRVAIPGAYASGNDVTMRLFFYRTGYLVEGCFVFSVDTVRLRGGSDILPYGETRWVRPNSVEPGAGNDNAQGGVFLVIDLPLNTASGLGYPNDLEPADFLAFELKTYWADGYAFHLLGVEFFESAAGSASVGGAALFTSETDVTCEYPDCNRNGIDDAVDLAEGTSEDCNENEIPDECDIEDGTSEDCNENEVPDECDLCRPRTDLFSAQARIGLTANGEPPTRVLWWDSTPEYGSQALDAYRKEMSDYLTNFNGGGVFESTYVSSEVPGTFAVHMDTNVYDVIVFDATSQGEKFDSADLDAVVAHYSEHPNVLLDGILYIRSIVYGTTTDFPGVNESTGKFTVNEVYQLASRGGGIMVGTDHNCCQTDANQVLGAIIPEALFSGYTTPSLDGNFNGDDLLNAIAVVSPFDIFEHWAEVPSQAIAPTGAFTDAFGNPVTLYSQVDVADYVGGPKFPYISTSWEPGGVGPEFDCNDNGVLDSEDIASGYSQDANGNGIPDECEELDCSPDCNENGIPDECDIADGTSEDCQPDGIPDECGGGCS